MATLNLGRIKPVFRGAYAGGTAYVVDDIVTSGDETFICIQASTGNATSNASYWTKLAAKGTDGTDVGATLTTQGDVLYRDGSGLQRLGAGTSGQFLKTQGTGANPVWANLASNVDIISHQVLDSTGVNSITTTTDWSTNNYYKIEVVGIYQMSSSQSVNLYLRNASGNISSDSYQYTGWHHYEQGNHSNAVFNSLRDLDGNRTNLQVNGWGFNASEANPKFEVEFFKPDPNNRQHVKIAYLVSDTSSPTYYANYNFDAWNNDTSTKTGWNLIVNNSHVLKNGFITTIGHKYQ